MTLEVQLQRGRDKPAPLYRQIADQIRAAIEAGHLAAGSRLPTVRELSDTLEVTPVTVQSAYAELREAGLATAVVGRGTFVTRPPADPTALYDSARSTPEIIRNMARLEKLPGVLGMAQGNGDAGLRPADEYMRCLRSLEPDAAEALGYWSAQGCSNLRGEIRGLLERRGITTRVDELIVTQGVTQALDLALSVLCEPGDTVAVESPTYLGFLGLLEHHGLRAVGVAADAEGPDPDALERVARRDRPRLFYAVPTFHNPTGWCMSEARREAVLRIAERHGFRIVEDDTYREIALDGTAPSPLRARDESGAVLYTDGFSKSLMPGLRIGYLLAPPALRPALVEAHRLRTLCGPTLLQSALAEFLRRGELDRHLARTLPVYRHRRDVLLRALAERMPDGVTWTEPVGGFSVWLSLPAASGLPDATRAALAAGVAVAPGERFLARPDGRQHVRVTFGGIEADDIPRGIDRLAGAIEKVLAHTREPVAAEPVPLV